MKPIPFSFVVPPSVGTVSGALLVLICALALAARAEEPANEPAPQPSTTEQPATAPPNLGPQPDADSTAVEPPKEPAPEPPRPPAPIPIQLQRYRVQVLVGFENVPHFSEEFRRSVLESVREGLARYVGEFWESAVAEERGRIFSGLPALKRLGVERIPPGAIADDLQKVYLLWIRASGAGFEVAGREWDVLTHQLGALTVHSGYDRREISETLLAVIHDVYRPVAAVEASKSGAITLRARGGEYPPRDESWQPLSSMRAYETFYCFLNKDRAVERVQQVPFTFVTPDDGAERGIAGGTVASGLRAPLLARRRIQIVVLGINSRRPETRLTLITRPPSRKPLAGVEVEISNEAALPDDTPHIAKEPVEQGPADKEKKTSPPPRAKLPRLVADRNGLVTLNASLSPTGQPVWLFVKSGQALLARVPIVPGAQGVETLELPDDTLRLETEGKIASLQAELVDTVARRAVLMSQARARAKSREWEAVAVILKQVDEMPKAPAFAGDINAIRIPALKVARAHRDRTTEARIQKLCDELAELVTNYLDEEKFKDLREELAEMRQLAADEATVEAQAKAAEAKPPPEDVPPADEKQDSQPKLPAAPKGF
jgi:hypothetical protein